MDSAAEAASKRHTELLNLCLAAEAKYTEARAVVAQQQRLLDEFVAKDGEASSQVAKMQQELNAVKAQRQASEARFAQQRTLDGKVVYYTDKDCYFVCSILSMM